MLDVRLWVGNLGRYNEGTLEGDWLSLPVNDPEEIDVFLWNIGVDPERDEYFIADVDGDIPYSKIGEYANVHELNDMLDGYQDIDEDAFKAALEYGYCLEEALEVVNNGNYSVYSDCSDMAEVAEQFLEMSGDLDRLPDRLRYYFDYEAYGRDMEIEGNFVYYNGDYYEFF